MNRTEAQLGWRTCLTERQEALRALLICPCWWENQSPCHLIPRNYIWILNELIMSVLYYDGTRGTCQHCNFFSITGVL